MQVLLRWHCQDYDKAKKCKWLTIRHPVVTSCECGCNKNESDDYEDNDF